MRQFNYLFSPSDTMCLRVFLYLFFLINISSSQIKEKCSMMDTCSSCIRQIGCAWCISNTMQLQDFRPCFSENQKNNSLCSKIISPQLHAESYENAELLTGKSAIQFKPQKVRIHLRQGQEYKLEFKYAQAANYPVDLYYVMDLSGSMQRFRDRLSELGVGLADTMKNLTKYFRIGFGSFVDKSIYPFTDQSLLNPCVGENCDYVFKNHLSLTDDATKFSEQVARAKLYYGGDPPEDALDALLQAIVCQKEIGWRKKAHHLLVFTTDASYHLAGDGKTAGIVIPHDGKCYLKNNSYTHGLIYDFPTIGLVNAKAIEHGINIIFAITDDIKQVYIPLQRRIKNSFIRVLAEESSNIIDLIKEIYGKIVDSVQLSDNSDNNLEIKYFSNCTDGQYKERSRCDNLHVNEQVHFTASIKLVECPADRQKTIFIRPSGLNEVLQVDIKFLCDCDCDKNFKANASECSNQGNLKCGICDCFPNKLGSSCECDRNIINSDENSDNCRPENGMELCSGLGVCKCNKCICRKRNNIREINYGKYCQCNNYSCKRNNGEVCSGETRGICDCGKCRCLAGFTGDSCQCPDSNTTCISPKNNLVCSGRGICRCGKCDCNIENGYMYSGNFCDECSSCKGSRCADLQHCVECTIHGTGLFKKDECIRQCTKFNIQPTDRIDEENLKPNEKFCISIDAADCYFKFMYWYNNDKSLNVFGQKTKICSPISGIALMFIIVGSILLGGLIMLVVWKSLTVIHDRKEYAKFEEERRKAGWNRNDNPLFKNPTTCFSNPTFSEDIN